MLDISEFYIYAFQIISECSTNDIYRLLNDGITQVAMNKPIQYAGKKWQQLGNFLQCMEII